MSISLVIFFCFMLLIPGHGLSAMGDRATSGQIIPVVQYLLGHGIPNKYPPDSQFTSIPTNTNAPLPDYLQSITGPVFHNRITRLSSYPDVQVSIPYPKTPSWNSDGTLLMVSYRLVDGRSYQLIAENTWWDDDHFYQ